MGGEISEVWKRDFQIPKRINYEPSTTKASHSSKISFDKNAILKAGQAETPKYKVGNTGGHKRYNTKSSLSKFVNKKPSYLRDTAGSKTKKMYGKEKAERIRTRSREKSNFAAQNLKNKLHEEKESDID